MSYVERSSHHHHCHHEGDKESSPKCTGQLCNFECSICLDLPQDPVVTMCGHLFCWSCLHQWITIHSTFQECPVCRAGVKDKIVPLYGRGKVGFADDKSRFDILRPAPAQRSYIAAPSSTGYLHHGVISDHHENLSVRIREGQSAYAAASIGLFPALLGLHHMLTVPEYYGSRGLPAGPPSYNAHFRLPAIRHTTSQQQQRMMAPQEFVLYCFLTLLACFASFCFLLF